MAGPSLPDRDDEPLPSYSPLASANGESVATSSSHPTEPLFASSGSNPSPSPVPQEEVDRLARRGVHLTQNIPIDELVARHPHLAGAVARTQARWADEAPATSSSSSSAPAGFGSSSRAPLDEFEPEPLGSLNPESAKKLALEADAAGRSAEDYNFAAPPPPHPSLPPPSFGSAETADRPQYSLDSQGNITSHSHLLNTSPDALLRFLRLHASAPPSLSIHLRGTHLEKRHETRWETNKHGRRVQRTESRDEEVEDFQFWIDGSHLVEEGLGRAAGGGSMRGLIYAALPHECLRRGGAWSQRGLKPEERGEGQIRLDEEEDLSLQEQGKRALSQAKWKTPGLRERRRLAREHHERDRRGLPGFVVPEELTNAPQDDRPLDRQLEYPALLLEGHFLDVVENHASTAFGMTPLSATLPARYAALVKEREERDGQVREVVEAYCASKSVLKELKVEKEAYGWNWRLLEQGLRATIQQAGYNDTVQVSFDLRPQTIVIRPDNPVMKVFSLPAWAKILLWLVFVYPIFLIFEFFLGRRFEQLRVAFPLVRWRRLPTPRHTPAAFLAHSEALSLARQLAPRPPKVKFLASGEINPSALEGDQGVWEGEEQGGASSAGGWVYLVGTEEGAWLKGWEVGVQEGVRRRVTGRALGREEREAVVGEGDARGQLRGYL